MSSTREDYELWHARQIAANADGALYPWHKTVLKLLPDLNGKQVLEIGCGSGHFSEVLAAKNSRAFITGVDFSHTAIAIAKERQRYAPNRLLFAVEDAQGMTFPEAKFDFVVSCECLEHIPEPQKMCREIARVLKPGGGWVLTTENYFNGMALAWLVAMLRKQAFDSGSGVQPHENFFLFWRVRRMLQSAGLQVEHMESNHFQWLLLPRCRPDRLQTSEFNNPLLKRLFRPFGRHFTFQGKAPLR